MNLQYRHRELLQNLLWDRKKVIGEQQEAMRKELELIDTILVQLKVKQDSERSVKYEYNTTSKE